jgi:hypothetical protein
MKLGSPTIHRRWFSESTTKRTDGVSASGSIGIYRGNLPTLIKGSLFRGGSSGEFLRGPREFNSRMLCL